MRTNTLLTYQLTDGVLRQYIRHLLEINSHLVEQDSEPRDSNDPGFYSPESISQTESRTETYQTELGDIPFFFTKIADFGEMTLVTTPGVEPGEKYSVVMTSDEPYTLVISPDPRDKETSKFDEDLGVWTITNRRFMWFDKTLTLLSPFTSQTKDLFKRRLPELYASLVDDKDRPNINAGSTNIWLIKNSELSTFSQVEESTEILEMINEDPSYPVGRDFSFIHEGPSNVIIGDRYEGDLYFGFLTDNTPASTVIATYKSEIHVVASTTPKAAMLRTDEIGNACATAISEGQYTPKLGDRVLTIDKILASSPNVTWVVVKATALKKVGGVKQSNSSVLEKIVMPYRDSPGWLKTNASTVFDTVELVCSTVGLFFPPALILSAAASVCNLMLSGGEYSKGYMTTGGFTIQIIFTTLSVIPLFGAAKQGISLATVVSRLSNFKDDALKLFYEITQTKSVQEIITKLYLTLPAFKEGVYSLAREALPSVNTFISNKNLKTFKSAFLEIGTATNLINDVSRFRGIVERTMIISNLGNAAATQLWDDLWRTALPDPPKLILVDDLIEKGEFKEINRLLNEKKKPETPTYKFTSLSNEDDIRKAAFEINSITMSKFISERDAKIESIKKSIETLDPVSSFFTKRYLNDLIDASKNLGPEYALSDKLKAKITLPDSAKVSETPWEWFSIILMSWILIPSLGVSYGIDSSLKSDQ